ncbi:MAG: hypothetical protein WC860_05265 [Candidatus Margulisiibacteriota bacterium]|jgi:hypothetical protein
MIYEILNSVFKQRFYITSFERLKSEQNNRYIESFIAKHQLLKPKIIMHDDQPFGFKGLSRKLASLDKIGIFCEISYVIEPEVKEKMIEDFDLYAEVHVEKLVNITKMIKLAKLYGKYLYVEQVKSLTDNNTLFIISSKLNEIIIDFIDQDLEEEMIEDKGLDSIVNLHLMKFSAFLKVFDELIKEEKKNFKNTKRLTTRRKLRT